MIFISIYLCVDNGSINQSDLSINYDSYYFYLLTRVLRVSNIRQKIILNFVTS